MRETVEKAEADGTGDFSGSNELTYHPGPTELEAPVSRQIFMQVNWPLIK